MSWGTRTFTAFGQQMTVDIDTLPTTTERPNVMLPNIHVVPSGPEAGKLYAVELPGLYVDPAEYAAASPGDEVTLYRSLSGDNENHQCFQHPGYPLDPCPFADEHPAR